MRDKSIGSYVSVYKAEGQLDGEIVKAFLEAQGVPAMLSQDTAGKIYGLTVGNLGEVDVLVAPADEAKARELLRAMESGEYANEILVSDAGSNEKLDAQSQPEEAELKERKRVLFLCTGNSARSQMAEAVVNHELWDRWIAVSAGTKPTGYVHPYALAALEEAGIFHQGESKSVEQFKGQSFDLVVTVCDQAREACPLWLGPEKRIHVGFEDPAAVQGTEEEKMAAFRKTLKLIRVTIPAVLKEFEGES